MVNRKPGKQEAARTMARALVLALALAAGSAPSTQAEVHASVDRPDVPMGERVRLTIRSRGASLADEPDLSPLAEDFAVLGQRRSLTTRVAGGRREASLEWTVELMPLELGSMEIPPIALGSETTEAIALNVRVVPPSPESPGRKAAVAHAAGPKLVAEVDTRDPYVQEQVSLTLRLESGAPLLGGELRAPEIPGALVEPLGEDRSEVIEVAGRPVHVFERRYAVFPQQSGPLIIQPGVFEGTVEPSAAGSRRRGTRRSPFDALAGGSLFSGFLGQGGSLFDEFFGTPGQSVRAISEPLTLTVRERPDGAPGERWLPAQDLELVELWGDGQLDPPVLVVGEPVDRVVAIRARSVTASQLPLPEIGEVEGLKQYSDPAYEDSQVAGQDRVAVRALPTVLIPTRPGVLTLPAVEVPWWDTQSDQARVARLPERTVQVIANPGAPSEPAMVSPMLSVPAGPDSSPPGSSMPDAPSSWMDSVARSVGLVPWLAAVAIWFAFRLRERMTSFRQRLREWAAVKRACRVDDAPAAEKALVSWAGSRWAGSKPLDVADVARRLGDPDLEAAVTALCAQRYGRGDEAAEPWRGAALWAAFRRAVRAEGARKRARAESGLGVLPALYPNATP